MLREIKKERESIMFKNAKIGDRVWSNQYGWGTIENIYPNFIYPIYVRFNKYITTKEYTKDGKYRTKDKFPTLFWSAFEIPEIAYKKPLPKLKVDTKVVVWNSDGIRNQRHFSHFDKDGKIHTFSNGLTSWTNKASIQTTVWDYYSVADEKNID